PDGQPCVTSEQTRAHTPPPPLKLHTKQPALPEAFAHDCATPVLLQLVGCPDRSSRMLMSGAGAGVESSPQPATASITTRKKVRINRGSYQGSRCRADRASA